MSNGRATAPPQPDRQGSQTPAPASRPAPAATGPQPAGPGNTAMTGRLEDGGFLIQLGGGVRLNAEDLEGNRRLTAQFQERNLGIPGLRLTRFVYNTERERGEVRGELALPHVVADEVRFSIVDREGNVDLNDVEIDTQLPALNNPTGHLGLDDNQQLSAELQFDWADLKPSRMPRLEITGSGAIRLTDGHLSGNLTVDLAYQHLAEGQANVRFNDAGQLSGDGYVEITHPVLAGTRTELRVQEDGSLSGTLSTPVSRLDPPVPGLSLTEGSVSLNYDNQTLSGGLEGVKLVYRELGEATLNASIADDHVQGSTEFNLNLPGFSETTGRIGYNRQGRFFGRFNLSAEDFPDGLPVRGANIRGSIDEEGAASLRGRGTVTLGSVGGGELSADYQQGRTDIGATVELTDLPGLQSTTVQVNLVNGQLEGSADIAIDSERLPGISTTLHVEYRDQRWSAEQQVSFSVDDGRLEGTITLGLQQAENDELNIHGGGDVTAEIAPNLEGTLQVTINPDGTVDTVGEIRVPEPIELFPEERVEREIFQRSQNIPLWAILVAVIRLRAGMRAGVGPGVLRDITVTGEYTIGAEEQPSFAVTGELYIPAFAEAYLGIGAGLGLDVKLGSLTGGIEGMATAGIYGAISVIPELAYDDGDYLIEGTATMAAGAKFKLGLNAWAEIEALFVTVWDEEWELAEWVWDLGPNLALQAELSYNFSNPEPPEISVSTEDIPNAEQLIQDAIPKDGPPASGARETLRNEAQWQGPTRERGGNDRVPGELADRSRQPGARSGSPSAGGGGASPQHQQQPQQGSGNGGNRRSQGSESPASGGRQRTSDRPDRGTPSRDRGNDQGRDQRRDSEREQDREAAAERPTGQERTVTEDETPTANQPRYPRGVNLGTLQEPPAPQPRTAAQQREDLDAARQVLELAARQVDDSESLDDYFLRIKRRFRLSRVAYVTVGEQTKVALAINPDLEVTMSEMAAGTGLAGKTTEIRYGSGDLQGHTVGAEMTADPLGPDHPRGSGPSGQRSLMGKLVTDTSAEGDRRFIRGHLLNDQLGGVGRDINLFPITHQANQAHESQIESRVKQWVNTNRYWTYYRVRVSVQDADLSHPTGRIELNSVNASFHCEAAVYTLDNRKVNQISATIVSRYTPPAETQDTDFQPVTDATEAEQTTVETRQEDRDADIRMPARMGDYRLDSAITNKLDDVLGHSERGTGEVRQALRAIPGIGPKTLETLFKVYKDYKRHGERNLVSMLSSSEKGNLTRLNRLGPAILRALDSLSSG
ncbi:hypothetical protein ACFOZ5_18265 [Marinobacter lacisalsi]|uniref:DNA/RNA non-specific endonuclease n=1 Tax=Marinobacter lacisalsi TaxID=475979 RepID=A0ABV8QPX7_9GAMM